MMRWSACLVLGMVSCVCIGAELHVSTNAAGGGNGSRQAPYQTLTQARDAIRVMRKAGTLKSGEAMTVILESGVYRLGASFELASADGGTADAPVVYRARERGKARLQGGIGLEPSSFKQIGRASCRVRV